MEESPSCKHITASSRRKDHRAHVDETNDSIKCTSKHCQSCTAGAIADCVAVCCCPCAVLSFFTLAFFKAPYMMGRRCLGIRNKKQDKSIKSGRDFVGGVDASSEKGGVEIESLETNGDGFEEEDREEAERVWLELYQFGHLGFGRVSFSGNLSQGKSN